MKIKTGGLRYQGEFISRHPRSGVQSARLHGPPHHPDQLITVVMAGTQQQDTLVGANQVHRQAPKPLSTERSVIGPQRCEDGGIGGERFYFPNWHLEKRRQPLGRPKVVQIRLCQNLFQAGRCRPNEAGMVWNQGARRDFTSEVIDQLNQKRLPRLPQYDSLRRIRIIGRDEGNRQVDRQHDLTGHDKFVQMQPAGRPDESAL